jgi:hypothetical protein
MKVDKRKFMLDAVMSVSTALATVGIFLGLVITIWQFLVAEKKEKEAATALNKAVEAYTIATNASDNLVEILRRTKDLAAQQEELTQKTSLLYLTKRAESGQRSALIELKGLASAPGASQVIVQSLNRVLEGYEGDSLHDQGLNELLQSDGPFGVVISRQDDYNFKHWLSIPYSDARAEAIRTIWVLRVNAYVPDLVDIALNDEHLWNVQLAVMAINSLLEDHRTERFSVREFVLSPDRAREEFKQVWDKEGPVLLKRKPKYWIDVNPKANPPRFVLVDPETNNPAGSSQIK